MTKDPLKEVTILSGTTSIDELVETFIALVVEEMMSLDIELAGCVYKEILLHPTGTPVPILSVLLSHT